MQSSQPALPLVVPMEWVHYGQTNTLRKAAGFLNHFMSKADGGEAAVTAVFYGFFWLSLSGWCRLMAVTCLTLLIKQLKELILSQRGLRGFARLIE